MRSSNRFNYKRPAELVGLVIFLYETERQAFLSQTQFSFVCIFFFDRPLVEDC